MTTTRGQMYGPLLGAAARLRAAALEFDKAIEAADPDQYLRMGAWVRLERRMAEAKDAFEAWMIAAPADPKAEPE